MIKFIKEKNKLKQIKMFQNIGTIILIDGKRNSESKSKIKNPNNSGWDGGYSL